MAKTLSLTAISFNEAEHLDQWVNNHRTLADEIVLLDTDSTDGTQAKATELGIKLVEKKWHHDFAEAKNEAIRHSKGDWILFLSPDYWINPECFAGIRKAIEDDSHVAYGLPLEHCYEAWPGNGQPATKEIERKDLLGQCHIVLFKNDPAIFYTGRVHESVRESLRMNFTPDQVGYISAVRHHDSKQKVINNPDKLKYYDYLITLDALERKAWEYGQELRKKAYDNEI